MPRIPRKDDTICTNPPRLNFPKPSRCPPPQYDDERQEISIAELLNSIENRMVPKNLSFIDLLEGEADSDAFIYVDNNGTPIKVNLHRLAESFDLEIKIDGGEIL